MIFLRYIYLIIYSMILNQYIFNPLKNISVNLLKLSFMN